MNKTDIKYIFVFQHFCMINVKKNLILFTIITLQKVNVHWESIDQNTVKRTIGILFFFFIFPINKILY